MKNLLIKSNANIKNTLKQLSKTGEKCLVVVDNRNKILGTISDGDVRKALLKGKVYKDKINEFYQKDPIFLKKDNYSLSQAKNILIKKRIDIIPIIGKSRTVVDVLTFEKIFKKNKNNHKSGTFSKTVVIMAGGKGTRLEPFTSILPKPMVPINEKPVIEHIIEKFVDNNNNVNFFITLNYKSRILRAFFQEKKTNYKLSFVEEPKPLGTAGGLSLLKGKIKKPFLVTNCDTIININFDHLMSFHISNKNNLTLVASSKEYIIPYGTCKLNESGQLRSIVEKPKLDFFVNIGLYVLSPDLIKLIPKKRAFDMPDLIKLAKRKKKRIGVYPIDDKSWIDVGQWSEYRKAIKKLV
tara:strand:- start:2039 stop:3097 length:1059 start_codon:yes stop_codon:yes gene_type:complete